MVSLHVVDDAHIDHVTHRHLLAQNLAAQEEEEKKALKAEEEEHERRMWEVNRKTHDGLEMSKNTHHNVK